MEEQQQRQGKEHCRAPETKVDGCLRKVTKKRRRGVQQDNVKALGGGEDMEAEERTLTCASCGRQGTVSLDYIQGILVCEDCGHCYMSAQVRKEHHEKMQRHDSLTLYGGYDLVSNVQFDQYGRPEGIVRVNAHDSGMQAGVHSMQSARARKAVQFAQPYDASFHIKKTIMSYGNGLGLPRHVVDQAQAYALELLDVLKKGSWRRELIVVAALYISVRMNRLPLTLLDIMSQCMHAGLNVYVVGKYYRLAVETLGLEIPVMDGSVLLPKLVERIFSSDAIVYSRHGCTTYVNNDSTCNKNKYYDGRKDIRGKILDDATRFLEWLSKRELHAAHPQTIASVSLVISLEMNEIYISVDAAAASLGTSSSVLRTKCRAIKQYMVSLGKQYLPFGENIKVSNVSQYVSTIMKISDLPSSSLSVPEEHNQNCLLFGKHSTYTPDAIDMPSPQVASSKSRDTVKARAPIISKDADVLEPDDSEDIGLEDVDEYIRSPEEVILFQQLQELQEAKSSYDGIKP